MSHKHFPFGPVAIAVAALLFCASKAPAQVTYEYRPALAHGGTPYTAQIEVNPVVGERPITSCLRDTDQETGVDRLESNEEACAPSKGTILVPYNPDGLIISTDSATYIIKRNTEEKL